MSYDSDILKDLNCNIFTPDNISEKMSSYLYNKGNLLDPAVGTGNLLKYIDLSDYNSIDIYDINMDFLNVIKDRSNITKYNLDFLQTDIKIKYNNIILNPPYIRFQNLQKDCREFIKNKWPMLNNGNIDIYYAFIIKCIELLDENGIMISITPNSYLYNKSAYNLRKYLIDNKYIKEIIDFKEEKVFKDVGIYCCITVYSKNNKKHLIYNDNKIKYDDIQEYNIFNTTNTTLSKKLGDICNIRNGIATLRDKIYIHPVKKYDEPCWKPITDSNKMLWIIYPYENNVVIDEQKFKLYNPKTYKYLLENKDELSKRDKGNKKYPTWYAYGRSQSIKFPIGNSKESKVIYISTMINPKNIKCMINDPILHYKSLCIEILDDNYTCDDIINIILDNKEYISNNSSKRGNGWINLSSTLLKNISF